MDGSKEPEHHSRFSREPVRDVGCLMLNVISLIHSDALDSVNVALIYVVLRSTTKAVLFVTEVVAQ